MGNRLAASSSGAASTHARLFASPSLAHLIRPLLDALLSSLLRPRSCLACVVALLPPSFLPPLFAVTPCLAY